jgi:endonuclease/exonuclease/phosphatase family metal-dependent hydrolase
VHPTTNLQSGRIPTGSGIALSPYFEGAANKERVERDRYLEMLSIGATDQLKLQEVTLTQLKQHHADHAGEPQAATLISDSMLLIQEMTDSIRTHVLPRKDTPPPPRSDASARNHSTVLHNRTLRIASLNIRGKALGSLPELVKMIGVVEIDILGLQEVFTSRNLKIPGFSWYGLGGDCAPTKKMRGIGFLVSDSLKTLVTPCTRAYTNIETGPEIAWLKLVGKTGTHDTYICNTYVPSENHPLPLREDHFSTLSIQMMQYQAKGNLLLLGDFNAHLGDHTGVTRPMVTPI